MLAQKANAVWIVHVVETVISAMKEGVVKKVAVKMAIAKKVTVKDAKTVRIANQDNAAVAQGMKFKQNLLRRKVKGKETAHPVMIKMSKVS